MNDFKFLVHFLLYYDKVIFATQRGLVAVGIIMGKTEHIKNCQKRAAKHPALRGPIMVYMFIYLALFHMGRAFIAFLPKLVIVFLCILAFVVNTSFNFSMIHAEEKEEAEEETISEEDLKVMLEVTDGEIEAEKLKMSGFSASSEDLEQLYEQTRDKEVINVDPGNVLEDTVVYDAENDKYVVPTFEDDWSLILVNKTHLIPEDYDVELETIRGNIKADVRIVDNVLNMIKAAKEDGVIISICSPYRDYDRQVVLFNRKVSSYIKRGYTEEEAYDLASNTVAIPGTSEHQLGLAFDFISNDYTSLDEGFANTDAGKWLKKNGAEYGFILRYPDDKVDITDIQFEPWHYRYVGDCARYIMDNGLCLEEYVEMIGMIE